MAQPTTPPDKKPDVQTVAQNDAAGATEDVLLNIDVLANDRGNNLVLYSLDQNGAVTAPAALTNAVTALGALVTINADGTVGYDSSGSTAVQKLAAGQVATDTFIYWVQRGGSYSKASVTVTVTGTNDVPLVSAAVVGSASEDGASSTLRALANASDVDAGTILQVVNVPPAGDLPAGVSYDPGTGTFTLDPAHAGYQQLGQGETATVTVSYGVSDGTATTPASVAWTVTGTNDTPVISGSSAGEVTEDLTLTASGRLIVTDPDAGESELRPVAAGTPGSKGYGTFEVKADGSWVYTLDNGNAAVQALNSGQSLTDTIIVYSEDLSAPKTISVTIRGANDEKVILGTPQNDQPLNGTEDSERIIGNGAEDFIYGFGGDDIIEMSDNGGGRAYGGLGNDAIYGGDSSVQNGFVLNIMNGDEGDDGHIGGLALSAGSVVHNIATDNQAGRDTFLGGNALAGYVKNKFWDSVGGGHMRGGTASNDGLVYNNLQGGTGSDFIIGGDGRSSASFDTNNPGKYAFEPGINAPAGVSVLNIINALGGADTVVAGQGTAYNQIVLGDLSGADQVTGGGAYTLLQANAGLNVTRNDHLVVTTGWMLNGENLRISGTINEFQFRSLAGNDILDFSQSAFTFNHVLLNGGNGADTLLGQPIGRNTFVLEGVDSGDRVVGGSDIDLLHILPANLNGGALSAQIGPNGNNLIISGADVASVEILRISPQRDGGFITMGGDFTGTGLREVLVEGGNAVAGLNIDLGGATGGEFRVSIVGGRGMDAVRGSGRNDFIDLGAGNDHIDLSAGGNDTITFRRGSDTDFISGFTAGSGEGMDKIVLRGFDYSDFETLMEEAVFYDGYKTIIDVGDFESIVLFGVDPSQLTADNFVFAP